jgi:hypothetical protein
MLSPNFSNRGYASVLHIKCHRKLGLDYFCPHSPNVKLPRRNFASCVLALPSLVQDINPATPMDLLSANAIALVNTLITSCLKDFILADGFVLAFFTLAED